MTIHRVGADPLRLKLRRSVDELRNIGAAIETGLAANYLGVVLDRKLTIIPAYQIAGIEIEPAPNVLISHVITDAESV
jgi:hypothetical protein